MNLNPLSASQFGYVPDLTPSGDKVPQLRVLSTNDCPNSSPTWLTDPVGTCPPGLTTFGYCHVCWELGFVPAVWAMRVDAFITAQTGAVS